MRESCTRSFSASRMARKHAYLILAHGQFDLLRLLVSALDDERNDIYVHIDLKSGSIPTLKTQRAGLFFTSRRVKVYWGDVSQIEAELLLFEEAIQNGPYLYYHLLSGVDLPLKSQNEIHRFFDLHEGQEFIGFSKVTDYEITRKARRWHLFPHHFKSGNIMIRMCRALCLRVQEFLNIKRNNDISFRKGPNWVSITDDMIRFLISKKEWALKSFRNTFCCDELFVQTVCWNSSFREKVYNTSDETLGSKRLMCWKEGVLFDWNRDNLLTLKSSPALFARKFSLKDISFLNEILALSGSYDITNTESNQ